MTCETNRTVWGIDEEATEQAVAIIRSWQNDLQALAVTCRALSTTELPNADRELTVMQDWIDDGRAEERQLEIERQIDELHWEQLHAIRDLRRELRLSDTRFTRYFIELVEESEELEDLLSRDDRA